MAQLLVDRGDTTRADYAPQALKELPYRAWREYDPEDTVRWYTLRLNEAGFTKAVPQTSSPTTPIGAFSMNSSVR